MMDDSPFSFEELIKKKHTFPKEKFLLSKEKSHIKLKTRRTEFLLQFKLKITRNYH